MKYLFTIHSPLTFLVAYTTIEQLNLPREEVILIYNDYTVPIDEFRSEPAFQDINVSWYRKLLKFNVPKHYDRYIDHVTGGDNFVAFVDLMSYYQKILVTHERCSKFHFIEEGNSAYMAVDDLADLTWQDYLGGMGFRMDSFRSNDFWVSLMRVLRGYNLRLISIPYHYMAFVNFKDIQFYCFSKNAFFNAPDHKKVQIVPRKGTPVFQELAKDISLEGEVIWIDGSNGRYTGLPESFYYRAIDRSIEQMINEKKLKDRVYVKLRPGTTNFGENYLVCALRKASLQVEVLPGDLLLECLFIESTDCTVIGNLTAALEYAHVFGHEAYSIYSLFEERPPTFLDRMEGFWKNVKKL